MTIRTRPQTRTTRCSRSPELDGLIGTWLADSIRASGHQRRANRPDRSPHPDRSQHHPKFTFAARGLSTGDSTFAIGRGGSQGLRLSLIAGKKPMRTIVLAGATALAMAGSLGLAPTAGAQKGPPPPPLSARGAAMTAVAPPPVCPVLNFSLKNRTNGAKVNALFNLTNQGPGTASNMKVTGITCTGGYAYSPMPGLLVLPFTIPTVPTLGAGSTVSGFNGFFSRSGGPIGGAFSCTITSTSGPKGQCIGSKVVLIP